MSEQSTRWRRAVPVALLALVTAAGLASATSAAADPLGPSAAGKGAPAAAPPSVSDAGCTLSSSLTVKSEQASCLGVGATLSSIPALGQTATLHITVKAGRAEKATQVSVDLPATLAFADGTATRAAVTGTGTAGRATVATTDMARGDTRTYTRTVKAVGTGFGEIAVRAVAVVDAARTDGGADYVHLTVGATAASSAPGAAQATGDRPTVATSAKPAPLPVDRPSVAVPAGAAPSSQVAVRPDTAGQACATGHWYFVDQAGVTRGVYQAVVQVWRSGSVVASGFADGNGAYTLCWSTGGSAQTVYVRFVHTNNAWKVVTNGGSDYAYVSGTQTIADGATGNFGGLQPADSTQMRGLHAYYDAAVTYDWIYQNATFGSGCWSPFASSCRQLVVHWQNDSTDGTYWNGEVHLLAASPDSEDEPVHEYNHDLMYGIYGNTFPSTTNCSPHYLFSISSTTCGWTEGYADWADTSVWGNTIYTFANLSTVDFNVTWGSYTDTGDQVEGRIVQALDSLNDGVKYPFDNLSGPGYRNASNFWAVMRTYRPNTFASFWSGRSALGQDVGQGALSALFQGTIDYGFRNPLTDGVTKAMPQALVPHNYSATTTRGYWSAVAVRPADGSDSDLSLYNDSGLGTLLGSSSYGGSTTDFVAVNSNSGARPLQTYYPRVTRFAGTGGYSVEFLQGSTTFSAGTTTVTTTAADPISIRDSYQTSGVPVYYRAVPVNGQSVALSFLQPGQTIIGRGSAVSSAVGSAGQAVSLVATPSATGYGGLVLVNQGMSAGSVTLYADTTAPTGGSVSINGGAATTSSVDVTLALSASDAETGVSAMQISTDGVFDTEPVLPYSTSGTATLSGANTTKTVYARFQDNAGIWSSPVSDTIALRAAPAITSITPAAGPTAGGNTVTLNGERMSGVTAVLVAGVRATNVVVVNDNQVTARFPARSTPGTVGVKAKNAFGTSTPGTYRYVAPATVTSLSRTSGPAAGGTTVLVYGTGFTDVSAVTFSGAPAASYTVLSSTKIRVVTPAHAAGQTHVQVTTVGGTSTATSADAYRFR